MKKLIYSGLIISSFFCHAAFAGPLGKLKDDLELQGIARKAIKEGYKLKWDKLDSNTEKGRENAGRVYHALFDTMNKQIAKSFKRKEEVSQKYASGDDKGLRYLGEKHIYETLLKQQKKLEEEWGTFIALAKYE